ncbi:MAG TPA: hypothetical protein VKA16_04410 [Burkholderiales bacterium]|nr:hypothetical protein [Burkholderiales bacterium]
MSFSMRDIVVSTIAYFVAAFFIKRQFDEMEIPRGMTRSMLVFALALGAAYAAQDAR